MLNLLKNHPGSIEVNGVMYNDVKEALQALNNFSGELVVVLNKSGDERLSAPPGSSITEVTEKTAIYKIKVKPYMTKPASPEFDFHDKWNEGRPMPLRIMVGRKLKETKGMVQMELWGEITEEITQSCVKCGKTLTNPVSKYFGIGPECGGHNYTNPFSSDQELKAAVGEMQKQLRAMRWTGWVIKSAIEAQVYLEDRQL